MIQKIILLNQKPKNTPIISFLFLLICIITLTLSFCIKTYDIYSTTGLIECNETCKISLTMPYNKIDIISTSSKIKYLNQQYEISNIKYEEPYLNNNVPYEDIVIETNLNSQNKIINFQILSNKQRIITKIKNIILERNQ